VNTSRANVPQPACPVIKSGYFVIISCAGGYTTGPKPIIDLLRNRSRPYLFSNSLPPPVVASASKVFDILMNGSPLIEDIKEKTLRYDDDIVGRSTLLWSNVVVCCLEIPAENMIARFGCLIMRVSCCEGSLKLLLSNGCIFQKVSQPDDRRWIHYFGE